MTDEKVVILRDHEIENGLNRTMFDLFDLENAVQSANSIAWMQVSSGRPAFAGDPETMDICRCDLISSEIDIDRGLGRIAYCP